MSIELFVPFCAKALGITPNEVPPERGSARETTELLWIMMKALQDLPPDASAALDAQPYDATGAAEFDAMLEAMEADPTAEFGVKTLAAASVWRERVFQGIMVAELNELAGTPTLVPPRQMPKHLREVAAALLWLHRMDLPFPPGSRPSGEFSSPPQV